ncbi:hypothetical protein B7486_74710, partial [cyanobacterium TDX16]
MAHLVGRWVGPLRCGPMALTAGSSPSGAAAVPQPLGVRIRGFVALTKPRIIQELLITTVPPMVVAEQGLP